MKTTLITSVILLSLFLSAFIIYPSVSAVSSTAAKESLSEICKKSHNKAAICDIDDTQDAKQNVLVGPNGMITRVTEVLIWISGTLGVILIIISGLMFIFSSGNPESAGRARRTMLYAVIGVVVAVVGQLVVTFVLSRL